MRKEMYLLFNILSYNIVKRDERATLVSKLCTNYNDIHRKRTIFCLGLFINNVNDICMMKRMCGFKLLFKILILDQLLLGDKIILIEYIRKSNLTNEEEKDMIKIIKSEELLNELKTKEITSFSYPKSQYSFFINKRITINPEYNGTKCKFSIYPSLPCGIIIDEESGIIYGEVENIIDKKEYEIICRNNISEKKFKMSLQFIYNSNQT